MIRFTFFLFISLLTSNILLAQKTVIFEDFNTGSLPTGWSTSAISGGVAWSFGTNGGNNLDNTAMAFFDDDTLGSSATNNTAVLVSPVFDISTDSVTYLEFDYNFRSFRLDSFKVEVYDGSNWNLVFYRDFRDCGTWNCASKGNFPRAKVLISPFKNANCQLRFPIKMVTIGDGM